MDLPVLTVVQLQAARTKFEEIEPRDLVYRVVTELIDLALRGQTSLRVAEALALLLKTWNHAFYRFHPFSEGHFREIEGVLSAHQVALAGLRDRSIDSLRDDDGDLIRRMFGDFEVLLGPVGAAKCLHMLAPRFFPLWDRVIAQKYRVPLGGIGTNSGQYLRFMSITKDQCDALGGEQVMGARMLKTVDEYNYCTFTRASQWTT